MPNTKSCGDAILTNILRTVDELNGLKDVDAILEAILLEARKLTGADAGTIFVVRDGRLAFGYVNNDTLFPEGRDGSVSPEVYQSYTLPLDGTSLVGHVALTGQPLLIDDAYALSPDLPYRFNKSFDEQTGYRTRSLLTQPIKSIEGRLMGVMQLINALGPDGLPTAFAPGLAAYLPIFAQHAAAAIARGRMTRELVLRMVRMAELRDPSETGAHVQRVGAYAAEIYHSWALKRKVPLKTIKRQKDLLRIAAMLHDVGKVGVSDAILKKPARLTSEEFATMQWHTVYGARLFDASLGDLDELCRDIALRHHERWAGGGYPGLIDDRGADPLEGARLGEALTGEAIPLAARITALADVYDALSSRRTYKAPWPEERVLGLIRRESGRHFDPEVVEAFFAIQDIIHAIRARYPDPAD